MGFLQSLAQDIFVALALVVAGWLISILSGLFRRKITATLDLKVAIICAVACLFFFGSGIYEAFDDGITKTPDDLNWIIGTLFLAIFVFRYWKHRKTLRTEIEAKEMAEGEQPQ